MASSNHRLTRRPDIPAEGIEAVFTNGLSTAFYTMMGIIALAAVLAAVRGQVGTAVRQRADRMH